MKRIFFLTIFVATVFLESGAYVQAMNGCPGGSPFGGYRENHMWGWYGARNPVRTADQAERIFHDYFQNEEVKMGELKEKEFFYEADIFNFDNVLIDKVIIDKRTGRIRSIY